MSELDRLCELLDERGVKWRGADRDVRTWFDVDGILWFVLEHSDGNLSANAVFLTPEQAIAATLGRDNAGRYVGLRQGKYWERTENSDYYCGGCGWKVTDHDSYCPECGGALHKAALDSSNCTDSERSSDELLPCPFCGGEARIITAAGESWVLCDECKATTEAHTSRQIAIAAWNRRAES